MEKFIDISKLNYRVKLINARFNKIVVLPSGRKRKTTLREIKEELYKRFKIDVTDGLLSQIERNQRIPKLGLAMALSKIYDEPINDLFPDELFEEDLEAKEV